jgi:hypothetical protein
VKHCRRLFGDSAYLLFGDSVYLLNYYFVDDIQQNICLGKGFTDMDVKSLYFIPIESDFLRVFVQFYTQVGKNIADIYITHHLVYL